MREIRTRLKKCQPYFIEKDLLPRLYFKEDKKDTEYWIFKYIFINHLSELCISIRLDFSRQTINYKLNKILERNHAIIEEFLANI